MPSMPLVLKYQGAYICLNIQSYRHRAIRVKFIYNFARPEVHKMASKELTGTLAIRLHRRRGRGVPIFTRGFLYSCEYRHPCLYSRKYKHPGAYIHVNIGTRGAHYGVCAYSLDTGTGTQAMLDANHFRPQTDFKNTPFVHVLNCT